MWIMRASLRHGGVRKRERKKKKQEISFDLLDIIHHSPLKWNGKSLHDYYPDFSEF